MKKRISSLISQATLTRYPFHKSSLCPKCDRWYSKAKKIFDCPVCHVQLRIWPKSSKSKELYKKILRQNEGQRKRSAKYKKNNKKKISDFNKEYYEKNKQELKQKQNYKAILRASKKWKEKNKEKIKQYRKKYYETVEKPKRSKPIVK